MVDRVLDRLAAAGEPAAQPVGIHPIARQVLALAVPSGLGNPLASLDAVGANGELDLAACLAGAGENEVGGFIDTPAVGGCGARFARCALELGRKGLTGGTNRNAYRLGLHGLLRTQAMATP